MSKLTVVDCNGGSLATFDGLLNLYTAYGATPSCTIAKLADQNFSQETSAYKALVWYSKMVALGNHIGIGSDMANIANAWMVSCGDDTGL